MTWGPDEMRGRLAAGLTIGFSAALGGLYFRTVPAENVDLVNFMLGQLSIMTAGALAWYFSSSRSSQEKDQVLQRMLPGPDLAAGGDQPLDVRVTNKGRGEAIPTDESPPA